MAIPTTGDSHLPSINWQPNLFGSQVRLRPLQEDDFEALFAAASDPLIWELHPDFQRYTRERFEVYFRTGIESKGALAVIDLKSGQIIGSSRTTDYSPENSSVEIGFTFLTRNYWGGTYNQELKTLMLHAAFQHAETAYFVVGKNNLRSRRAMQKIGGVDVPSPYPANITGDLSQSVVYEIRRSNWAGSLPLFEQPKLATMRLTLEPITEDHTDELRELFGDPELHRFTPFEPISREKMHERCTRWSKRRSPDGKELWLNWIARLTSTAAPVGHFQVGIQQDGIATIGYLLARANQKQGLSTEALEKVFAYLRDTLGVQEVKAWSDTRNLASHQLAKKLGMVQVDFIKDADTFKGESSDEFIFSRKF